MYDEVRGSGGKKFHASSGIVRLSFAVSPALDTVVRPMKLP
jgi:hypothetical protein